MQTRECGCTVFPSVFFNMHANPVVCMCARERENVSPLSLGEGGLSELAVADWQAGGDREGGCGT